MLTFNRLQKACIISMASIALTACEKNKTTDISQPNAATENLELLPNVEKITLVSNNEPVSFNEHVQPILSEYCYHCHGPDGGSRQPEKNPLRLDVAAEAFLARENGKPVIIKGEPDASYLIELVESTDKDLVMPPHPETNPHGKLMQPQEIALLRRWVKEGAKYEDHWAYIQPTKQEFPVIKNKKT